MYGPGTAPPPPAKRGAVIGLRVLFTVLPMATLGVGAWGSVLRLALLRRRLVDWLVLPVVVVLGVGGFVLVGVSDEDSARSDVGVSGIMLCMVAVPVYFLIADILWFSSAALRAGLPGPALSPLAPPNPYATGSLHGGARGPIPAPPLVPPPAGVPGAGMTGGTPYGYGQAPSTPAAPRTPPPRINQVRAELDELSDYLRKEEGR